MMKKDGHIHTPFCPHGTPDLFEEYIEKAIQHHFTHISFTEHAPLPILFDDTAPDKDSGMKVEQLQEYIKQLQQLKLHYKNKIHINIGLEIDYISGYEKEISNFLQIYGPQLDDAILSVHFLYYKGEYCCVDFSKEEYLRFAEKVGGIQALYDLYYATVKDSILADLGEYKPKRIGHPTLIHKFQLAHNEQINDDEQVKEILRLMKQHDYELDFNSAGLSKPFCQEPYPAYHLFDYAKSIGLRYTFGSDAHTVKDLHQYYDTIFTD